VCEPILARDDQRQLALDADAPVEPGRPCQLGKRFGRSSRAA
jgi:hypothetical protein